MSGSTNSFGDQQLKVGRMHITVVPLLCFCLHVCAALEQAIGGWPVVVHLGCSQWELSSEGGLKLGMGFPSSTL